MRPARGEPDSSAVALSVRLFQRLLAAYPKEYRREYGPAMAQLFRDQCRDAWRHGRGWGLTGLWLRVLPDLVKTSVLEHLSTFKERKTMLERIGMLLRPQAAPWRVFIKVFGAVFLLVVATSTLVTFILPNTYSSTARVMLPQDASEVTRNPEMPTPVDGCDPHFLKTQLKVIQTEVILGKVIDDLDLNQAWGKKYAGGSPLKTSETLTLLKGRIDLRPVGISRGHPVNSTHLAGMIEIRVFSEDASESSELANAIARSYCEYRSGTTRAEFVDKAVPRLRPVRPNTGLNIARGIIGGTFLAMLAAAAMAGIVVWIGRKRCNGGAPPGGSATPPPDLPHVNGAGARHPLV